MVGAWLIGLLRVRTAIVVGSVSGVAITVGLIVSLGAFMQSSAAEMTERASSDVPIDWQVELVAGASIDPVVEEMRSAARIAQITTVGYAASEGFEAVGDGSGSANRTGQGSRHRPSLCDRFSRQYPSSSFSEQRKGYGSPSKRPPTSMSRRGTR